MGPTRCAMIKTLKLLFGFIFVFMVAMTIRTSFQSNLFIVWPRLLNEPWTVATLWDAYFGFTTFYVWVFYKESEFVARLSWLAAIMFLGNIAMSFYVLIQLFKLPAGATAETLLLRQSAPSA